MKEVQELVEKYESRSWDDLRAYVLAEAHTVPAHERIVFETVFGVKWPKFLAMLADLPSKTFEEIASVHKKLMGLGDFSDRDVMELALMATVNTGIAQSAKMEFYQIGRCLHTRPVTKAKKGVKSTLK